MAQEGMIQLNLALGFPANQFKEELQPGATAVGFGLGGAISPAYENPIYFGLEGGYMNIGKTVVDDYASVRVPRQNCDLNGTNCNPTNNYETVDYVVNNNIIWTNFFIRWRPHVKTAIVPYIDIIGGGNYFYTVTKLRADITKSVSKDDKFQDWAWTYGGAVGFNYMFSEVVGLDFKVKYLQGQEARYLSKNGIEYIEANGNVPANFKFTPSTSRTDMFMAQLGVIFYID